MNVLSHIFPLLLHVNKTFLFQHHTFPLQRKVSNGYVNETYHNTFSIMCVPPILSRLFFSICVCLHFTVPVFVIPICDNFSRNIHVF